MTETPQTVDFQEFIKSLHRKRETAFKVAAAIAGLTERQIEEYYYSHSPETMRIPQRQAKRLIHASRGLPKQLSWESLYEWER